MAKTKKGMKSELDQLGQTITGAMLFIVEFRNNTIRKDREPDRVKRLLEDLDAASRIIYGE